MESTIIIKFSGPARRATCTSTYYGYTLAVLEVRYPKKGADTDFVIYLIGEKTSIVLPIKFQED